MTPRERMVRTLTFARPDRIPRDLWTFPVATHRYPGEAEAIQARFPLDITGCFEYDSPFHYTSNKAFDFLGDHVDEWGCVFKSAQKGMYGEVKDPLVKTWADLQKVKSPFEMLRERIAMVPDVRRATDRFVLAGWANPFERMQFLRGCPNLYTDLLDQPREFFTLKEMLHEYFLREVEGFSQTDVDGVCIADDWGSQKALLISPTLWRELFKPLYREYCEIIHGAGKFVFFHSDGYIIEIYEDLIEIGVDALNSQLFCMDIEEIGRRFRGRITFWGEIDRQHILVSNDPADSRQAVRRVMDSLYDERGGLIAQCEFGAGARPENVKAVFAEWDNELRSPAPPKASGV